jgi:sulfoxide reductase catalytic subunit YedY
VLIKRAPDLRWSDVTERPLYLGRRRFLRDAGLAGMGLAAAGAGLTLGTPGCGSKEADASVPPPPPGAKLTGVIKNPSLSTTEPMTPFKSITTYNNFYELSTDKEGPAELAGSLRPRPWTVRVDGEVKAPASYDVDSLVKGLPLEERIYRMRCVEGWSMVIPWAGVPLAALLKRLEPTPRAKFVRFETLLDPAQLPGQSSGVLPWPYVEGLRLDEAMHPLALLAIGLYGETLPNQDGAPIRLVVPWKYGFKGIKSIVKITLQEAQPPSTWNVASPEEYGFYSNVNPTVDHPRWSQKTERRIGEFGKRDTLMFNGYADQVAALYAGMDLRKYF